MQSSSIINPTNNKNYLTPEHRSRLCQILNELTDNQLRFILIYHLQSTSIQHQFQQYTRTQLYQQCIILIDNYYTLELDKTICTMKSNHYTSDFYQQPQQQQQQQQQTNFSSAYNQQTYHFNQPNYRLPHSPAITQQLRTSNIFN